MDYVLGLDISTTASKALLVDEAGTVVTVHSTPHQISQPHPMWSEQDPGEWWEAVRQSIRSVIDDADIHPASIKGIGLTGQMHGLVMLDSDGRVLRPAMLWNDQRASAECDEIRELVGPSQLVQLTGNDAFAGFTAPKLLWVRKNEPEIYARTDRVLLPKDYIRFMLTGEYATDKSGAGGTLFLDLNARDWSTEILDALDIPIKWMPETFEGTEVAGVISETGAAETGLVAGCPVVGGGGDQAAGAVGMGAVSEEIWGLTVGTSGVVFAPTLAPVVEPQGRVHAFPHAVPGQWHLMGVMLSAAGSLSWYHDALASRASFEELIEEAATVESGSEGLIFLPYLSGERTPHADSKLRGSFIGLSTRHTRAHMTRAVLEGVAFGLADNFRMLQELGLPAPSQVRLSGGGSRSPLWRQIIADVLNIELVTLKTTEGAAFGAALLAGTNAGFWPTVQVACNSAVVSETIVRPDPEISQLYTAQLERFRNLYPALQQHFADS